MISVNLFITADVICALNFMVILLVVRLQTLHHINQHKSQMHSIELFGCQVITLFTFYMSFPLSLSYLFIAFTACGSFYSLLGYWATSKMSAQMSSSTVFTLVILTPYKLGIKFLYIVTGMLHA